MTAIREKLRSRKGSSAVEFIMTASMLILSFAVLISALIYVTQYYNASYICRRVARTIEVMGEYDERAVNALVNELGGGMDDLSVQVEASYFRGRKIQLRDEFTVKLRANFTIHILQFGRRSVDLELPIKLRLSGRSEVFWK